MYVHTCIYTEQLDRAPVAPQRRGKWLINGEREEVKGGERNVEYNTLYCLFCNIEIYIPVLK